MADTAIIRMILGAVLFTALFIVLINAPINAGLNNQEKATVIGLLVLVGWFIYLKYAIPRCPKCGYSVISVFEIKGFPLIGKMPTGNKCAWCGETLEQT
jgi:hypothetical protein